MMSQLKPNIKIYERERIILQSIKDNPDLHHNGLIKLIVPQYMAKTTFENARNSLIEKEILFVKKKGNMKFYIPTPNYKEKSQQRLEQNTNKAFHDIKLRIKDLDVSSIDNNSIKDFIDLIKDLLKKDNYSSLEILNIIDILENNISIIYNNLFKIFRQVQINNNL